MRPSTNSNDQPHSSNQNLLLELPSQPTSNDCSSDEDYLPPQNKRKKKHEGATIHIPSDILSKENVVSGAVRNKISPTVLSRTFCDFIEGAGGSVESICRSNSYVYNKNKQIRASITKEIKEKWSAPAKCIIHFDGKLVKQLKGSRKEERFPILVSGKYGSKLLGVPSLGVSLKGIYGETAATSIVHHLELWKCDKSVYGMVFDTTNSNSGRLNGVCICLERKLKRPLLWLACRHHVGETLIRNVWKGCNIETSAAPSTLLFKKFHDIWDDIKSTESSFYLPSTAPSSVVADFLKYRLKSKQLRDDYKEIIN